MFGSKSNFIFVCDKPVNIISIPRHPFNQFFSSRISHDYSVGSQAAVMDYVDDI